MELNDITTARDITFATDLPDGFDYTSDPFTNDDWTVTAPNGARFTLASEWEDDEHTGYSWTDYPDAEATFGSTDGDTDAQAAADALAKFVQSNS